MAKPDVVAQECLILSKARLFRGVSEQDLMAILHVAGRRHAAKNAFYFHEGDRADYLHILTAGQVKLTQITPEGHQVVLRLLGPGEMFGGIAAFGDAKYPASAQALADSHSLALDAKTVSRLMETIPQIAKNALGHLVHRIQEVQDRYRELATERVERRVARALLRLAGQMGRRTEAGVELDLPLSRQSLAEMTGTTLYTVSRILSQWEQQGLVNASREHVTICSPHGLTIIAEDLPNTPPSNA